MSSLLSNISAHQLSESLEKSTKSKPINYDYDYVNDKETKNRKDRNGHVRNQESVEKSTKRESKGDKDQTWWVNGLFVILIHLVGIATVAMYEPRDWRVKWLPLVLWWPALLGITAGYHRLWSHQSYHASLPLRIILALFGTLGFQGSIKWWVLRHRLHHRFTDTIHDPYSIQHGFFYAHIGWIFSRPKYPKLSLIDISDLQSDAVVQFQHRYFMPLALLGGFGFPILLGWLLNDVIGGLLYGGFVARLVIWHSTFSINSFAHWIGDQEFSTGITARGNLICSVITNGEGYHNFHHVHPQDYRNGIKWYHYDPTKWFIWVNSLLGLASDLKVTNENEIDKSRLWVKEEELQKRKKRLDWGPTDDQLPGITLAEFQSIQSQQQQQFIIDNYVVDVTHFKDKHPGGEKILRGYYGKDASRAFHGEMNQHTMAALNLLRLYRVAKIVGMKI